MIKKLIPRFKPNYDWREWAAAFSFWRNDLYVYEKEFATKFGCSYGKMFSYGRSGLYALFKIWKLENKEIITSAYTCVVVPHAIVLSGNQPRFVDCAKGSFNMCYDELSSSITKNTGAIVITHLFGYAMDVDKIDKIVKEAEKKFDIKIYVIQDLAHSYGTSFNGEMVSTYGDASIFGCNISKIINSIFGGMVITNNYETNLLLKKYKNQNLKKPSIFKEFLRLLYLIASTIAFSPRIYTIVNFLERKGALDRFTKYYKEDLIDFPKDWDEHPKKVEARVGIVQLKKYDFIVSKRKKLAKQTIDSFKNRKDIFFLKYDDECTYSHIVALVKNRKKWMLDYRSKGKQLGTIIDYSVPEMKSYKNNKSLSSDFPISRSYSKQIINFPIY